VALAAGRGDPVARRLARLRRGGLENGLRRADARAAHLRLRQLMLEQLVLGAERLVLRLEGNDLTFEGGDALR
jgi:hypothetical protein